MTLSHIGSSILAVLIPIVASGQPCTPAWSEGFSYGDFDGDVQALASFDADGPGGSPARLIATGSFLRAGGQSVSRIAQWNGNTWQPLGEGLDGNGFGLLEFDPDGAGPEQVRLYAAGAISTAGGIATSLGAWDGTTWSAAAPVLSGTGRSLVAFDDDGPGPRPPAVYFGGNFFGSPPSQVFRVENGTLIPVGAISGADQLAVFDLDGAGPGLPSLYAASGRVYRWTGTTWTSLGGNFTAGGAKRIALFDPDGPGPRVAAIFAGGDFTGASGQPANQLARWDGLAWSSLGNGDLVSVTSFLVTPDNSLLIGHRNETDGDNSILEWNGSAVVPASPRLNNDVWALCLHDDGSGTGIYAGGGFSASTSAGPVLRKVARLDESGWTPVGTPTYGNGLDEVASAALTFDPEGSAPEQLIVAGDFGDAGGVTTMGIAAWDGSGWHGVGGGIVGYVNALGRYHAPDGLRLIAGGEFSEAGSAPASNIASWNGATWTPLGAGVGGEVNAVCEFDADGPGPAPNRVVAGGYFPTAAGLTVNGVAAWDGSSWAAMGSGVTPSTRSIFSMVNYDPDGPGPAMPLLVAGGTFTAVSGVAANSVATWNGAVWAPLSFNPSSGGVYAVGVFDEDGSGPASETLFAGGFFTLPAPSGARLLARWTGTAWMPVGPIMAAGGNVIAFYTAPDGLYVGGGFPKIGDVTYNRLARWDGTTWHSFGSGVENTVQGVAVYRGPNESAPSVYAAGWFRTAGEHESKYFARWGCEAQQCYPDCNSDGALNLADFGCFQTKFALGDPYADCNGDGVRNLSDFGCFQTKFALGCP